MAALAIADESPEEADIAGQVVSMGMEHMKDLMAGFAPDGSCSLFARVVPNSTLEMMHIGDPEKKCDETCSGIKAVIPSPKFTLLMTCITRTMAFDRMGIADSIIRKYRQTFPTFCGFSCYGEQIGRVHCNQTLVSLVMGD